MYFDQTVYHSRPSEKRIPKEERCYDLLEALNIHFDRVDHEAVDTIEGCEVIGELLGISICKNLFLTNSKRDHYYLLMLPGEKQLVTRELAKKIGSTRLSFASPDKMAELLELTPGSVSVFGLMNDTENSVELLIDRNIIDSEFFGCHPNINTSSLRIKTSDLLDKLLPAMKHTPVFVEL